MRGSSDRNLTVSEPQPADHLPACLRAWRYRAGQRGHLQEAETALGSDVNRARFSRFAERAHLRAAVPPPAHSCPVSPLVCEQMF